MYVGREIRAPRVVITTGTFLRGTCYLGRQSYAAGRHMRETDELEPPSIGLALTLERYILTSERVTGAFQFSMINKSLFYCRLAFPMSRLKTGTPARLVGSTIDWSVLEKQPGDDPPPPFSYLNIERGVKLRESLIDCAKTYTNAETHRLVLENQHLLPDYEGGDGAGVRRSTSCSVFIFMIYDPALLLLYSHCFVRLAHAIAHRYLRKYNAFLIAKGTSSGLSPRA